MTKTDIRDNWYAQIYGDLVEIYSPYTVITDNSAIPDRKSMGALIREVTSNPNIVKAVKSQEDCFKAYKFTMAMEDCSSWIYCIKKDSEGRRYIGIKDNLTDPQKIIANIMGRIHMEFYTLTPYEFGLAQEMWTIKTREMSETAVEKEKRRIVVDYSVPGECDY